jgi:molybdopterin-containing oxidoreductase family iron-sulfur binding subunit
MVNRRKFLQVIGAGGAAVMLKSMLPAAQLQLLKPRTASSAESTENETKYGMVVDVGACIGCRQCVYACKEENNVPDSPDQLAWIDVFELDIKHPVTEIHTVPPDHSTTDYVDSPKPGKWYLSKNCFHCENPNCVKVCPVGATFKSEDGIVEMDYDKCLGCRYCMSACPYNARTFNWREPDPPENPNPAVPLRTVGVVEKCTFCVHRTRDGRLPRCVEVCPVGARHFGDMNDPESPVRRILANEFSFRLMDEMNTAPMLYYISSGKKWLPDQQSAEETH